MPPPNEIYFYSVVTALMSGLASEGISQRASDFLSHGGHGLGTFAHMDGEMVVVDGVVYQLRADGTLTKVSGDKLVSFGVTTFFDPSESHTLRTAARITSLKGVEAYLDQLVPGSGNHFVAFRVRGTFAKVKVRAIHAQEYDGEPLAELGKTQAVHTYERLSGELVGFRSPAWSGGFSVPGLHVHFIDEERTKGGHVLELDVEARATVQAVRGTGIRLELPAGEEFGSRRVLVDDEGLAKVEGG